MSLSLSQIDALIEALVSNSKELIFESETLFGIKSFARSYALAHFAREELAKCMILHAAGVRILAGVTVDWKKTMRRLRDHKEKLKLENVHMALLLAGSDKKADVERLSAAAAVAEKRNEWKNAALYVELDGKNAVRPSETVTEARALRTIELAKSSLDEQEKICKRMGPFTKRPRISIPNITSTEGYTSEQLVELFFKVAPIHQQLVQRLYSNDQAD